MAPVAIEQPLTQSIAIHIKQNEAQYKHQNPGPERFDREAEINGTADAPGARYKHYLPTWNPEQKYHPLAPFEHVDRGTHAEKSLSVFLNDEVEQEDLTPSIGAVFSGIQLSSLIDEGKNQLALLTAQRKVLLFKNQDFTNLSIEDALKFAGYFGRLHIHPTSGSPEGHPEVHIVHRGTNDPTSDILLKDRLNTITWHSDVTYEEQPPETTLLEIADGMIYQRAGIQEARYLRGQGITYWSFTRIDLPTGALAFSAPSHASGWSSRKSIKTASSRVSFEDDSEEEDLIHSRVSGRSIKTASSSSRTSSDEDSEEEDLAPSRASGRSSRKSIKTASSSRTSFDDGSGEEEVPSRVNGRSRKRSQEKEPFTKQQQVLLEKMLQGLAQTIVSSLSNDRRRV